VDAETYLNIEEVAEVLRVKVTTIRWSRQEGRFIPATRVGRRLVWSTTDVQTWTRTHREDVAV
jgi:excisionase family DNA binding protein